MEEGPRRKEGRRGMGPSSHESFLQTVRKKKMRGKRRMANPEALLCKVGCLA